MREKIGLRALEAVAIGSTALAFNLTIFLVTTGRAFESNPIAAELVGSIGWTATGVVAVTALVAAFAVLRWVEASEMVEESKYLGTWLTRGAGVFLAGLGVVDVAANVYLLTTVDVTVSGFWFDRYGVSALVVAVASVVALYRTSLE